ncbi:diflavin flavoprotein [Candidatus Synechococcus spongiarum]|uniref:Flavoprotein n=1 Tax=Candidatus Synechococcus spongiarum TaxID=431041 RepID=A0A165B079_9SYNE|nr:diflavin flavoprotein [Candidatus Synechococcus spongiarum]SAY38442.1 flavoprotein [Candidatus Synechococcus spongiarum]
MRRVITLPVADQLLCLRGLSPERLRFEMEYGLERGTSANSFFIPGPEATLIHPPGESFREPFLEALKQHCPLEHPLAVVVGHVNPNRVGLLRHMGTVYPRLRLLASSAGVKLLQDLWTPPQRQVGSAPSADADPLPPLPPLRVIRAEHQMSVGEPDDHWQLRLWPAPTPRWPGGLLAHEDRYGILFSGKFFAAHVCTEDLEESHGVLHEEDRRFYYDCLMAPMAQQVDNVVDRLEEVSIQILAPGHGPMISQSWRSLFNDYRRWGEGQRRSTLSVALLFASAYGNTAALAAALGQGVAKAGVRVQSMNCEFSDADALRQAIHGSQALLIGSPTLGGHVPTPVMAALGTVLAEAERTTPVGVFGSYGWSGEAIDLLETKLRDCGFPFAFPTLRVRFSPDDATLKRCEEIGTDLGQTLQRQQQQRRRVVGGLKDSSSGPSLQALGRVLGSLCVLTARHGALSGAMVASWVSQASFTPPGITVAVAKDRAVEQLLHNGNHFALNVLAAGREKGPMKHFLQPFAPGADRFAGLEITESPHGQPLLQEALAWLEVQVCQRMECGDHWLIYGHVEHGALLDEKGRTAVHQRRSGTYY